jgi:DNA-binding MarR family transcriptional regulator
MEPLLRTPALLAWLRMQRIEQKVHRAVSAQLQTVGLTDAQFYVLAHVRFAEGQIQQEVADARLVTQANICQMVTKLEGDGLLVRQREGRSNRLFLTERGRTLIDSILPGHERLLAAHFGELPLESQHLLHQLLRDLDHALDRAAANQQRASGGTSL